MTVHSVGTFDLLKTISSYPGLKASRDNRWNYLGLVNEPCFEKAPAPIRSVTACGSTRAIPVVRPDPFENEGKYPGVKIGARGKNIPVGSYYGYATGIVGLRTVPQSRLRRSRRRRSGTRSDITTTPAITTTRI